MDGVAEVGDHLLSRFKPIVSWGTRKYIDNLELKYKKIIRERKLSASADGKTTSRIQRIAWLRRGPGKAMESLFFQWGSVETKQLHLELHFVTMIT